MCSFFFFYEHFYERIVLYFRVQFPQYCFWKENLHVDLLVQKILANSRNFGDIVYNCQNCITFCWYFYAEWKTVVFICYIFSLFSSQSLSTLKMMAAVSMTLLYKVHVHRFLQKCLFTISAVRVFINVWLTLLLL